MTINDILNDDAPAVTVRQLATALGVSEQSIRRRIASGELAAFRVGEAVRIAPSAARAFLERNLVEVTQ